MVAQFQTLVGCAWHAVWLCGVDAGEGSGEAAGVSESEPIKPKWTPFVKASQASINRAIFQVKAGRKQYLESLAGGTGEKNQPRRNAKTPPPNERGGVG